MSKYYNKKNRDYLVPDFVPPYCNLLIISRCCREEGIRTLDTFPYTRVPGVRLRPLGHLSI